MSAAVYWAVLGWDRQKTLDPATGRLTGPYEPWQVILCVVLLAAVAFVAGLRGREVEATTGMTSALTICFCANALADPNNDGLWPVGALMVLVTSLAGSALLSGLGDHVRVRLRA